MSSIPNECSLEYWSDHRAAAALQLLGRFEESSLFLLGNLQSYGPHLTEEANSGNYRVIIRDNNVVAVFVLTRRGNLLLNSDRKNDYSDFILDALQTEALTLNGVLGDWSVVEALWNAYEKRNPEIRRGFRSKEILFRRPLQHSDLMTDPTHVRLLEKTDFEQFKPLRIAYLHEEGLTQDLSEEQFYSSYLRLVLERRLWGSFAGTELLTLAGLNTKTDSVGQVGLVYTKPEKRGQGLSKATMRKLMSDCHENLKLEKLVLFTGENNFPAQAVYRRIGFEEIGHFGMIFKKIP